MEVQNSRCFSPSLFLSFHPYLFLPLSLSYSVYFTVLYQLGEEWCSIRIEIAELY
jgi:hypothetical protein